jgi:hypothetical protein
MAKKTTWECETCGKSFNSRAARLYHRNNVKCSPNDGNAIETTTEPQETASGSVTDVIAETITNPLKKAVSSIRENKKTYEQAMNVHVPDPELDDDGETEETEGPRGLDPLLVLVGIILLFFAALFIFRDKIMTFYKNHTKTV